MPFAEAPEKRSRANIGDLVQDKAVDIQEHIIERHAIALGKQGCCGTSVISKW
jgi:hypothetical protein